MCVIDCVFFVLPTGQVGTNSLSAILSRHTIRTAFSSSLLAWYNGRQDVVVSGWW